AAGGGGGEAFEDVPKDLSLLVGLTGSNWIHFGPTIGSVQPIYLTGEGIREGPAFGTTAGRTLWRVAAKEGYAVGGIVAKPSNVVDGFKVVFMRIDGARLDPKDRYESAWLGGSGG